MINSALIGYTGFVGSNLNSQYNFTRKYNSSNAKSLINEEFDLVVCAGVRSVKWLANKNPTEDLNQIKELEKILATIKAQRFVLISTIDVYPNPINVDEDDLSTTTNTSPYGMHRFQFEKFILANFPKVHIVRLPGIFGTNIKKNVIFDLLNQNRLEFIDTNSSFQYYRLSQLWAHIQKVIENNISLINFATEPIVTSEIVSAFFPNLKVGEEVKDTLRDQIELELNKERSDQVEFELNKEQSDAVKPKILDAHKGYAVKPKIFDTHRGIKYDFQTKHSRIFGSTTRYIQSKKEVLEQMGEFIKNYKINR